MAWEMVMTLLVLIVIVFIILLIPSVLELRKTLARMTKLADTVNKDLPEILKNIRDISENANHTTERLNTVVTDVAEFEKKISSEIKEPALEAAASIAGFLQGIQTFITYFVKKKK